MLKHRSNVGNVTDSDIIVREPDVPKELMVGAGNAVIAGRLHISAGTVKSHARYLPDKTGFSTRTGHASIARSLCIVISE